ncbi:MAG TPA: hypothetical protein VKQ36_01230, partial [Ktedonobacterales bacterium]|nr:hypothetical protein [Ktedonobacterales bacterium]
LAYLPAMLLASPLTWQHYFVILLLPLLVLTVRLSWPHSAPDLGDRPVVSSGAVDAAFSPTNRAEKASASVTRRRITRGLLALYVVVLWIPTLVEQAVPARPLPGVTGPLVFALPMYLLVGLLVALISVTGGGR